MRLAPHGPERVGRHIRRIGCAAIVAVLASAAAQAQPRVYISAGGGAQAPGKRVTDRFTHVVNAEDAVTEARYPGKAGGLFDVGGGVRVWRKLWAGVHLTRSKAGGSAQVSSQVPHPLFDDRDRAVSGDAGGVDRTETAVHAQLSWLHERGPWQFRFGGGPSHFRLKQPVITDVNVDETYPYDTATFRDAVTRIERDSAIGFNVGAEVNHMLSRRFGAGVTVRYGRGAVDLNVGGTRAVSFDAGGAQVAAGVRIVF